MRKAIICILMIVVLCSLAACQTLQPVIPDVSEQQKVTGELQLLRSDLKLTQEQVMSQIKAEYLLENGGYDKDDDVKVMITLKDDALIDTYGKVYSKLADSVAQYAATPRRTAAGADACRQAGGACGKTVLQGAYPKRGAQLRDGYERLLL